MRPQIHRHRPFPPHVSIHAPREGCDCDLIKNKSIAERFQFTHPGRGATTWRLARPCSRRKFQFTHPGRGATLIFLCAPVVRWVSIHAPREGCDCLRLVPLRYKPRFNSRTPGGVRRLGYEGYKVTDPFQFTHPGRGATQCSSKGATGNTPFQFTHPGRGATKSSFRIPGYSQVSIHAPREGCDAPLTAPRQRHHRFNSRTPGGVRQQLGDISGGSKQFQFTHPGRGATQSRNRASQGSEVSIHAPREGCDRRDPAVYCSRCSFNSRTPGGVRQVIFLDGSKRDKFQFTHPGRGATAIEWLKGVARGVSIHAPREGCD